MICEAFAGGSAMHQLLESTPIPKQNPFPRWNLRMNTSDSKETALKWFHPVPIETCSSRSEFSYQDAPEKPPCCPWQVRLVYHQAVVVQSVPPFQDTATEIPRPAAKWMPKGCLEELKHPIPKTTREHLNR